MAWWMRTTTTTTDDDDDDDDNDDDEGNLYLQNTFVLVAHGRGRASDKVRFVRNAGVVVLEPHERSAGG